MNVQQQMSGQVPRRVPSQGGPQLGGLPQQKGIPLPSQMHAHVVDDSFDEARRQMQRKIIQILQRRSHNLHAERLQMLSEVARRLEECMFKDAISKDDYVNMTLDAIDQRLQAALRNSANNHQQSLNITSSSSISTMIPTPGMTCSGTPNSIISCSADNSMIATSGAGMVAQTASNAGNMLTTANRSVGILLNPSFHASNGSNRYQQSPANVASCSDGNSIMSGMSHPLSQMIPTPGLNNLQSLAINAESSNGVGISSMESNMGLQPPQQKQHVGSQNSRMLHALGGQMGIGSRSNFMHKSSPYVFSNGATNGGLGVHGNNMHMVNGPAVSDDYLKTSSYGNSTKSLQQQFDQQHNQPIVQASMSQQILSLPGDGYAVSASDQSVSENLYGSTSLVSSASNVNPMNLHAKAKINETMLVLNASTQPGLQSAHIRSQIYNNSQQVNFQPIQSGREHQPHNQVQSFQQQLSQPCGPVVQRQYQQHQQSQHQQQLMQKTDALRQSSISSNFGGQLMSEHAVESHNESLFPQSAEQYHLNELQRQYQQNTSASNRSKGGPLLGHSSQQDFQPVFAQGSRQVLHLQQGTESRNEYNSLLSGPQADSLQHGHWQPRSLQKPEVPDKSLFEQNIREEFQQRLTGQDDAQPPHLEGRIAGPAASTHCISVPQPSSGLRSGSRNSKHENDYHRQKRWLLFMLHARRCFFPKGRCKEPNCETVQQLWIHMERCSSDQCRYPRCYHSKKLVNHFDKCRAADCPLCIPVNEFIKKNYKPRMRPYSEFQSNDSCININTGVTDSMMNNTSTSPFETSEDSESCKRVKVHHLSSVVPRMESSTVPTINQPHACLEVNFQPAETTVSTKIEVAEVKIDSCTGSGEENLSIFGSKEDVITNFVKTDVEPFIPNYIVSNAEEETMLVKKEKDKIKMEVKQETNASTTDSANGSKSGKPKIKGVSLTELFTPEQIREHIRSLRQWTGQSKAKAEKNQAMERSMSENSCQLCAVEKLTFEPPPLYCNACGVRIKRNATYYAMGSGDTRHYFCVTCYSEPRGDTIYVEGSAYLKAKLEKKKNDEETEEWWVQCDKCEAWQHQICALFNGRRNDGGQAEYTCPNCCIEEIEKGERKPLPQSAVLGAKDLPRTILSDHIEQRLVKRLKQERQERARYFGKSPDEVPGAEALVIRVVSSVDKKLDVKQRFLEIFQEENYPTEYPYKSKVILLFQKIEGVEVCLFGMYVQEFGSESQLPNQRRVYLSYLDSVKYFRPEIRTVSGEALRTFVYHEILIGYLEYCKKRGFTSCYIWACPPLKGEDYILYCHPDIQKTPKSDKLREWYLSMLRKASKESIVVELTNLFDHFFASHGECKAKVTAARLPYFDGDYWPGAAEDMINRLQQEEDGRKQQKKGKTKKALTKRALKASGQTDLTGNASKDALLMQKLGETISPMKEDFIMVHLQHSCTYCCLLMASGTRWVCNQCKNFQLCDKCHNAEQRLEGRERHPINCREKHVLSPVDIGDVPSDTKDKDEILESEFFDTRQAFLSLCQGNHYQYDTLRRAKHSSMMVLYHLHNPTAPAFVTSCYVCHHDIETGHGWRCEICPDFDVCNSCYLEGGVDHPHKLTNHPSTAERDAQNQEARQKRVVQLRKMLDLLVHASQCRFPNCQYPNCRKVKGLFHHGIQCKTRASGGCPLCKKMWYLLQLHARACKESDCNVPRCKDLKEHQKRLQQQSDSRRRAAVMEMMRQRAAEVAGCTD